MNRCMLWFSLFLFALIIAGALRSVFQWHWWFFRKTDEAKQAYAVLAVAAAAMFTWAYFGERLEVKSIEIAGFKAEVKTLQQQVQTFSEQMEAFLKGKKIEVFNKGNWSQKIRKVAKDRNGFTLEVTLEQEPIPNTVEVFQGVLMMPEQDYHVRERIVRFPSSEDRPLDEITIKYYPRVVPK